MDLKKAVAGMAIGASLMAGTIDADAAKRHHHKHPPVVTISWDEAINKYLTDPEVVAKVLAGESSNPEGMKAVACVIQNRMQNQGYASAKDVVLKRNQFQALTRPDMMEKNYSENKSEADLYASEIGMLVDITGGATQFRSVKWYNLHKASLDKDYEVTKTIAGNVFMKERI